MLTFVWMKSYEIGFFKGQSLVVGRNGLMPLSGRD